MRKSLIVAIVVIALAGAMLLVSMAQNEGCLPWKERIGGDSPFAEAPSGTPSRCR
jgi:hypothetical protein